MLQMRRIAFCASILCTISNLTAVTAFAFRLPVRQSRSLRPSNERVSLLPSLSRHGGVEMSATEAPVAAALAPTSTSPSPKIRRVYKTYLWKRPSLQNGKEYDYYKINYRVEGDGSPILLVHGFGANVNHFRFQFPALVDAGYRVHAIDLLGFGASDKPAIDYSIDLFVELIQDFVRDKSISKDEKWVLAGNSIGGLCCLGTAAALPDVVGGVVLFNCSGGMSGFRFEDVPLALWPILWVVQNIVLNPQLPFGGAFFANFKTRDNIRRILEDQVYCDTTNVDDDLLEILLRPGDDLGAQDVFLRVFGGPPGPTPESILPNLSCPVLALWGSSDPWTPVDSGSHPGMGLAQYHPNPSVFNLQVLPSVGHCPHDESPDEVNRRMIAWMEQTLRRRSSERGGEEELAQAEESQ